MRLCGIPASHLWKNHLQPHLVDGGHAAVLAEEWHTADALLHLDWLLRQSGLRERATLLWNANNLFGFERIDWGRLADACVITTVSRYMKHRMGELGIEVVAIPNGLPASAFDAPDIPGVSELRRRHRDRTVLVKMARFHPDKAWLLAVETVAEFKRLRWRPLLVARGGSEGHWREVVAAALRRHACRTARMYDWGQVIQRDLLPRLAMLCSLA